jgi:hypothetical protein
MYDRKKSKANLLRPFLEKISKAATYNALLAKQIVSLVSSWLLPW